MAEKSYWLSYRLRRKKVTEHINEIYGPQVPPANLYEQDFCDDLDALGGDRISSDSSDTDESCISNSSLNDELSCWVSTYNVSTNATNALLKILQKHHEHLPRDQRTLMKTITHYNIVSLSGGHYYHFGVEYSVFNQLRNNLIILFNVKMVNLQINIDGLPLFKSSSTQLWPILGRLTVPIVSKPFVIGLFLGNKKPDDANEFLTEFIDEAKRLQTSGLKVPSTDHIIVLHIDCVICDAPAKSYVKKIKGHSGYYGCDKCSQPGVWKGKMTFPKIDSALRTDDMFNQQEDEEHHIGFSIFQNLQIGMVSQFPMDYMHLVCLGVMKRLLSLWIKGPLNCRQGPAFVRRVNEKLTELRGYLPHEFLRKGRALCDVERWKAVEFRQFLLYTGPVILQGCLPTQFYEHFLLLFVSIYCLSSPLFVSTYCQYADQLLHAFVNDVGGLYGEDQYVYNIHGLIHLAEDVSRFGVLDMYSAFPFESYLGKLKKLVRKPNFPLQQVVRRLSEEKHKVETTIPSKGIPKKQHRDGPILQQHQRLSQYKQLILPSVLLSCSFGDNCILVSDKIGLIRNILSGGEGYLLLVEWFRDNDNFFTSPLASSDLRIFHVRNLSETLSTIKVSDVTSKCVLVPHKHGFVTVPLIHHLT